MVFEIMVKIVLVGNSNSEVEVLAKLPSEILQGVQRSDYSQFFNSTSDAPHVK